MSKNFFSDIQQVAMIEHTDCGTTIQSLPTHCPMLQDLFLTALNAKITLLETKCRNKKGCCKPEKLNFANKKGKKQ